MNSLPSLAVDQILSYLNVTDLLACSLVSTSWRAVINSDPVWKTICYKQCNNITINYLQEVSSKILPIFEEPDITDHVNLQPLCHWRIVFMKLMHVKRNWQKANHKTYKVTDVAYNHFDLKINNDLLVSNVNDNKCEVWNIRGRPHKEGTVICALKNTRCKTLIHLLDNLLVIVQDTLLQVYNRRNKQFTLGYRRLFNQPEYVSSSIPGVLHIDDWYNNLVKRRPTHLQAYLVGKYFIGLAQNGSYDNSSFHVWDVVTGSMLKEEVVKKICPNLYDPIYNIKFCPSKKYESKILVSVHYRHAGNNTSNYTVVLIYDLCNLTFRKVNVLKPHVPWIFYEDNLLITVSHNRINLNIYSSSTGKKTFSKICEEIINPDSVQMHGEYLGFTTGSELVILKVTDFEVIFKTTIIKFSSNMFGFDFVFLYWNLILITKWDQTNKIEVWSIDKQMQVGTLSACGLMFPCNNFGKFFVWNEMITTIYMLHFW